MPPALVALKVHIYDGRQLKPGDRFTARGIDDARVLKAIGVAKTAPAQKVPPVRAVLPDLEPPTPVDDETATVPEPDAPADEEPKRKRTYRRRDLVAEESCNSSD